MWKESAVVYSQILCQHLSGTAEENDEKITSTGKNHCSMTYKSMNTWDTTAMTLKTRLLHVEYENVDLLCERPELPSLVQRYSYSLRFAIPALFLLYGNCGDI
jgi:hypothetical protein